MDRLKILTLLNPKQLMRCISCFGLVVMLSFVSTSALSQSSQIQGPRDNAQLYSGVVYGPIDQSDTLWRIASRYKRDERFSVYQTMQAIFELNPQAFENGNFNTMVNGATLQMPSDRYIARMDAQQARLKAERDERIVRRSRGSSDKGTSASQGSQNLKPDIPLVNQNDLSKTQQQLQSQLNALRNQQTQQFELLKNEVVASINSVQSLLEQNTKLNDQLRQIDENNRKLTETVENELQSQIDQQVQQINELIAMARESEQRRLEQEQASILSMLSSPLALIILMSLFTLLVIIGLAVFLLRRSSNVPVQPPVDNQAAPKDIVDDDLVIGEMSEQIDSDSDDLLAALSEENNIEDDDILSDELADEDALESLTDMDLNDALDGLDDDMLVPDSPISADDLSLDDLDDLDGIEDEISLDGEDELGRQAQLDGASKSSGETNPTETPEGIDLDTNGDIDKQTLDQIEEQIEQKDESITQLTDELMSELDEDSASATDGKDGSSEDGDVFDNMDQLLAELEEQNGDTAELDALLDSLDDEDGDLSELDNLFDESDDSDLEAQENEQDTNPEYETTSAAALETADQVASDELQQDQVSVLADELLDELEQENSETEQLDELLDSIDETDSLLSTEPADDLAEVLAQDFDTHLDSDLEQTVDVQAELGENTELESPESEDPLSDIPSFTNAVEEQASEDGLGAIGFGENDNNNSADVASDHATSEISEDTEKESTPANVTETAYQPEIEKSQRAIAADAENSLDALIDDENDEDVLSSLPDLDNWLDDQDTPREDIVATVDNQEFDTKKADPTDLSALEIDPTPHTVSEDDPLLDTSSLLDESEQDEVELINNLDKLDFDDLLEDIERNEGPANAVVPDNELEQGKSDKQNQADHNELSAAGLDIEALMNEPSDQSDSLNARPNDDYLEVDKLLQESEATPALSDEDLVLDLDSSLDKLSINDNLQQFSETDTNVVDESDQASNLDLAQVYFDMEDFDGAKSLLSDVLKKGNIEQRMEAQSLLDKLPK